MATAVRKSRHLIPGEDPAIADINQARRWLSIYEQRLALLANDANAGPQQIAAISDGVDHWRKRVSELSGLELDSDRRLLRVDANTTVLLTRRELQLLEFLLQHPEHYFADYLLALRAWGDRLSGDQVRIYVRRLRAKLAGTGWELVSRRGHGYALERRPLARKADATGSQRPSHEAVALAVGQARALVERQKAQLSRMLAASELLRDSLRLASGGR